MIKSKQNPTIRFNSNINFTSIQSIQPYNKDINTNKIANNLLKCNVNNVVNNNWNGVGLKHEKC